MSDISAPSESVMVKVRKMFVVLKMDQYSLLFLPRMVVMLQLL